MGRPKKKHYRREYMRQHYASKTFVSNDGERIDHNVFDMKHFPRVKVEILTMKIDYTTDRKYVWVDKKKYYVDEMVLACYRGYKKDDKRYIPHHKDGDMRNSHINNLEWREKTPQYLAEREKIIAASKAANAIKDAEQAKKDLMNWYKRNKINVNRYGQITQGGQPMHVRDSFFDSDLDWTYHVDNPWVEIYYKNQWGNYSRDRFKVNKIMEDFGKIAGDKANFKKPVVLYKNHDFLDTSPGNLEWCDASDQRYIDFKEKAHKDVMVKDHDIGFFLTESEWEVVYGKAEPYQAWTDRPPLKHLYFGSL